jgi:predicted ABC-type ATPase
VLQQLDQLAVKRVDFAFETTFNGLGYVRRIRAWKRAGYKIEIVYLKLQSTRLALRRIAARVREGGHNVPRSDVIRRFSRGGRTSRVSTSHWRTCGRYTTILGESRSFWRKTNEDQATWQDGPHDCSEGWARSAPSCQGRAPNCPHAWCSDLRLGKGKVVALTA